MVDLDGTLVATDTLWESLCSLVAYKPHCLWRLPVWLRRGKALFKHKLAQYADMEVKLLPYRQQVLDLVRSRKAAGCRVVLATASDGEIARQVAAHLGLFDGVLASDGQQNCRGAAKLKAIRSLLGEGSFDYIGDSNADLPVVAGAARVWLVNPSSRLRHAAEDAGKLESVIVAPRNLLGSVVRLLRPHQWAKNLLLFVPMIAAHHLYDPAFLLPLLLTFICFSLAASAIYMFNDLCDLDSDRVHERKRNRPLASGEVTIPLAGGLTALFLCGAFAAAMYLRSQWLPELVGGYLFLTTSYSIWIKRKVFLDVILLAALYSYRVFAGGVVTGIPISDWLIVFSMFLFLCLALAKRYCELDQTIGMESPNRRRGYRTEDVALLRTLGPVSGYLAVLVMALFISSDATASYPRRQLLWLVCPILLYWVTRLWFLAHRREMADDPLVFALKDMRSLFAGAVTALIVVAASMR